MKRVHQVALVAGRLVGSVQLKRVPEEDSVQQHSSDEEQYPTGTETRFGEWVESGLTSRGQKVRRRFGDARVMGE